MKRTIDPENPPWTDADFRRARPSREVVPHIVAAYLKRRGRETEGTGAKVQVSLLLDSAVVEHFKAQGVGWQTRINDALVKVIGAKVGGGKRR